jgi:hypothetical protein
MNAKVELGDSACLARNALLGAYHVLSECAAKIQVCKERPQAHARALPLCDLPVLLHQPRVFCVV